MTAFESEKAPSTILIIGGDKNTQRVVSHLCGRAGFHLEEAAAGRQGLEIAKNAAFPPDAVLLNLELPDCAGEELLQRLRRLDPELPIIVLTACGSIGGALRAGRAGAFGYLTKPFGIEELKGVLERALAAGRAKGAPRGSGLRTSLAAKMGESAAVSRLIDEVEAVIATDYSVFLVGETGSGKELIAQALHEHGPRRGKAFVAVDCGALVDGLVDSELFGHERGAFTGAVERRRGRFERAAGGTLFLDEIGNLSPVAQRSLLRALETRSVCRVGGSALLPVDLRVIAATNEPVAAHAASGAFRRDLYFRLAEYTIVLPPLRSRPEDIASIARRFVAEAASELGKAPPEIAPSALALLRGYDWPGNGRELRNVMRRATLAARAHIAAADVAGCLGSSALLDRPFSADSGKGLLSRRLNERIRAVEREAILAALAEAGGNKAAAARLFGVDYKTFRTKLKTVSETGTVLREKNGEGRSPAGIPQ